MHAAPGVHDWQVPVASQTAFVPHAVPGESDVPVSTHVSAPVAQEVVPVWHGLAGVQERPAVHATHDPEPLQTWFVPQLVPAAIGVAVSTQVSAPVAHDVVPWTQALGFEEHAWPAAQATHVPDPSQTWFVPQLDPAASGGPSTQTGPAVHDIVPLE